MTRTSPLDDISVWFTDPSVSFWGFYVSKECNNSCPCSDFIEIREQLFAEWIGWTE